MLIQLNLRLVFQFKFNSKLEIRRENMVWTLRLAFQSCIASVRSINKSHLYVNKKLQTNWQFERDQEKKREKEKQREIQKKEQRIREGLAYQ